MGMGKTIEEKINLGAKDYLKFLWEDKRERSPLSTNALQVLKRRYLKKDEKGNLLEDPEKMFMRVSKNIASADIIYDPDADIKKTQEEFFNLMSSCEFLPNSPTLMNAGARLQQLSACFVLPIEDTMESIFETIKDTALIHKSGGGTGFSFSRLRPANSPVASTNGVSSGPLSFMKVFDSATEAIKQGGTRRGANMGILNIDHPDILDFIRCKHNNKAINNFNISIALTAKFMEAVKSKDSYELIDPHTGKAVNRLSARAVFDEIVSSAWKNGEPGVIFMEKINEKNPTPHIGNIESTNPCGEQPLLPYESCNLGSINLSRFVTDGEVNYKKLKKVVHTAVHFLDNVIDMNRYPLHKIEQMTKSNRKIGLGVMGFADLLILCGVSYNSKMALGMAEEIMSFIDRESKEASRILAEKRGPFPNFKGSAYDLKGERPIRNATTTTIAPTGTISIVANCSSGIEPLFAVSYIRRVMDNDELVEVHPIFKNIARKYGFYSDSLIKDIAKAGSLKGIKDVPDEAKRLFVTSHEIEPQQHINIQAAFQKYTDNAVSKTVNFSHDATKEDVSDVYLLAYKKGLKGVTIYRDGSREEQVLNTGRTDKINRSKSYSKITPRPRPQIITGSSQRIRTGCGNLYVTINEDEEGLPFELFTQMGKAGGCSASQSEAIGRLVSLAFRSNIEPEIIVKQLSAISCHLPAWENGKKTLSCSDAIAKAIDKYLYSRREKENAKKREPMNKDNLKVKIEPVAIGTAEAIGLCPTCYGTLERIEGCLLCRGCGYSKCD